MSCSKPINIIGGYIYMKRIFIFVAIIIVNNICILSQPMRIGVSGNFLIGNKYYDYQFGPSLIAEYSFEKIPISIRASTSIYFSELSSNYLPGYDNNVFRIGALVNYFPIDWAIEPFIGLGIFYNFNSIKAGGMPATINGSTQYIENFDNDFSLELSAGIKFSAKTPFNFIVEIAQDFSKSRELITFNTFNKAITDKKEIDIFNSLFVRFGLLFQI